MKALTEFENLSAEELLAQIKAIRETAGERLAIFAHYYVPDEVVAIADVVGDSLALAQRAAESNAEALLFCGVHFMLETADILANRPEKVASRGDKRMLVMAPDLSAGCPMADMITAEQAYAWKEALSQHVDFSEFTPVSYVNSSAATKAFCGENGGAICTSANAEKVLREAFERRPKALFMPDSRLGRTTALALGVNPEEIATWNPRTKEPLGGLTHEEIKRAKVILWDGFCPVHQRFSAEFIQKFREDYPDGQVWVHPEAQRSIVELSDGYGSTSKLIDVVSKAPTGSTFAIGTEWKLVNRLQTLNPDKTIIWPGEERKTCSDMTKASLAKIAHVLQNWSECAPVNVVTVPENIAELAYISLKSLLK